jgi:hypothetical protein
LDKLSFAKSFNPSPFQGNYPVWKGFLANAMALRLTGTELIAQRPRHFGGFRDGGQRWIFCGLAVTFYP